MRSLPPTCPMVATDPCLRVRHDSGIVEIQPPPETANSHYCVGPAEVCPSVGLESGTWPPWSELVFVDSSPSPFEVASVVVSVAVPVVDEAAVLLAEGSAVLLDPVRAFGVCCRGSLTATVGCSSPVLVSSGDTGVESTVVAVDSVGVDPVAAARVLEEGVDPKGVGEGSPPLMLAEVAPPVATTVNPVCVAGASRSWTSKLRWYFRAE